MFNPMPFMVSMSGMLRDVMGIIPGGGAARLDEEVIVRRRVGELLVGELSPVIAAAAAAARAWLYW